MYYKSRKEDENRFLMEKKGDWFPPPYQCKKCWFVNVFGKLSRRLSIGVRQTIDVLHRANLDIFWSQYTANMKGILGYTQEIIRKVREEGRLVPLTETNYWPVRDKVGMIVAIEMMENYLYKRRNVIEHLQFNTVYQLQEAVSNVYFETSFSQASRYSLKSHGKIFYGHEEEDAGEFRSE